ncbi:hypothetical protein CYMTET_16024 [Cymbomonas tetramitiformis]|uniref:Uncharacterized protein n=1 Tax=Cymbomonas tetramitiformis TaxID=36881 RepID=A0AAE0GCU9_9CHLO|nr:hypothetical protein CYMTET_16024 [Cymbomonas tetramitiformis]
MNLCWKKDPSYAPMAIATGYLPGLKRPRMPTIARQTMAPPHGEVKEDEEEAEAEMEVEVRWVEEETEMAMAEELEAMEKLVERVVVVVNPGEAQVVVEVANMEGGLEVVEEVAARKWRYTQSGGDVAAQVVDHEVWRQWQGGMQRRRGEQGAGGGRQGGGDGRWGREEEVAGEEMEEEKAVEVEGREVSSSGGRRGGGGVEVWRVEGVEVVEVGEAEEVAVAVEVVEVVVVEGGGGNG